MGEGPGKGQDVDAHTRWLVTLSLMIVLVLAVIMHLGTADVVSLGALFLIAVIVFTNITHLYKRNSKNK